MKIIAQRGIEGDISRARGDVNKFEGGYRQIVEGINSVTEITEAPLKELITVMSALSVNDLTVSLEGNYKGIYNDIAVLLTKLSNRMKIIQNLSNKISLGDLSDLDSLKAAGKLSENDQLMPSIIALMENIKFLLDNAKAIAKASAEGDLLYRINTSSMHGDFATISNSFNNAFDQMAMPLIEIASSLETLAAGNTTVTVAGKYFGVFETLSADVNKIVNNTKAIINEIKENLDQISSGNLNLKQAEQFEGEWNVVPETLNHIVDSLNALVGNIFHAVNEVYAGSQQLSIGSQELSRGATVQASAIEELTASIAEIASKTKLNAQNASQASTLAKGVRDSAMAGNEEMKDMVTSMHEIDESSHSISKIIKVIDDIAFQTNLLALNAAVEAARAGQHGKGFAVVAEEVRNLAARSAKAANETAALIEGSLKRIEKGTRFAVNTAKNLDGISNSVDKVASLVESIASSSSEQATGIAQVNQGLEQVSKVVQTNSATAEQSAAASEQLSGQADELKGNVEKFTLRSNDSSPVLKPNVNQIKAEKKGSIPRTSKPSIDLNSGFGKY